MPEEQEASSIAPGNPEPQTGVNIASMPDAGGGSSMQPESATESQSPATEEKPIAPETSPASNDAAEVQDPRPGVEKDNNTDSTAARPPDPPAVAKVKIHLVAVGSAPILKRTKFQIGASCAVALLPFCPSSWPKNAVIEWPSTSSPARLLVCYWNAFSLLIKSVVARFVMLIGQPRTSASGPFRPLSPR